MAQSIPTTSSMGGASTASFIPNIANDLRITDETSSGAQNDLIQVTRNGCIFFVHRTQAMAEQFTDRTLPNLEKSHSNALLSAAHALGNPAFSLSEWEALFSNGTLATTPRWCGVRGPLFGLPDTLRHQLEAQAHELLRQLEPDDKRYLEIPPEYGAAWPLDLDECTTRNIAGSFGYPSIMYKVVDRRSGAPYALRRVDGARISPKAASATQIRWRSVQHANLISLRRAFVHSGATYFLHEYCPCAKTLLECHFPPHPDCLTLVPESTLWSYLLQLVSALRVVHATVGACRTLGLSRILVTGDTRIHLANVGVIDVLEADMRKMVAEIDDIVALGHILLALATKDSSEVAHKLTSQNTDLVCTHRLHYVASRYSRELHALILELLTNPPTVFALCDMLSGRAFDELDTTYRCVDTYKGQISAEVGAGRVLKVLLHLSSAIFSL